MQICFLCFLNTTADFIMWAGLVSSCFSCQEGGFQERLIKPGLSTSASFILLLCLCLSLFLPADGRPLKAGRYIWRETVFLLSWKTQWDERWPPARAVNCPPPPPLVPRVKCLCVCVFVTREPAPQNQCFSAAQIFTLDSSPPPLTATTQTRYTNRCKHKHTHKQDIQRYDLCTELNWTGVSPWWRDILHLHNKI